MKLQLPKKLCQFLGHPVL